MTSCQAPATICKLYAAAYYGRIIAYYACARSKQAALVYEATIKNGVTKACLFDDALICLQQKHTLFEVVLGRHKALSALIEITLISVGSIVYKDHLNLIA